MREHGKPCKCEDCVGRMSKYQSASASTPAAMHMLRSVVLRMSWQGCSACMDARVSSLVERRPVAHSPLYLLTSARTGAPAAEVPQSFVSRHIYLVPSGLTLSCETSSSVRILVPHRGGLVARVTSVCGRLDRRRGLAARQPFTRRRRPPGTFLTGDEACREVLGRVEH